VGDISKLLSSLLHLTYLAEGKTRLFSCWYLALEEKSSVLSTAHLSFPSTGKSIVTNTLKIPFCHHNQHQGFFQFLSLLQVPFMHDVSKEKKSNKEIKELEAGKSKHKTILFPCEKK